MGNLLIIFAILLVYFAYVGLMIYDARNTVMTPKMARRIVLWPLVVNHYIIKKMCLCTVEFISVIVVCFKKDR